jgi:hypothetical protein
MRDLVILYARPLLERMVIYQILAQAAVKHSTLATVGPRTEGVSTNTSPTPGGRMVPFVWGVDAMIAENRIWCP